MKLLIPDNPVVYLPELARRIGVNESVIAQQIYYAQCSGLGREIDGVHWIYNSLQSWSDRTGLTVDQVRRAINNLVELGLVVKCNPRGFDRTTHYRVITEHAVLSPIWAQSQMAGSPIWAQSQMDLGSVPNGTLSITKYTNTSDAAHDVRPEFRAEVLEVHSEIVKIIETHCQNQSMKSPRANSGTRAKRTIDRVLRLDGIPASELIATLRYALADEFWSDKLLGIGGWRTDRGNGSKIQQVHRQWRKTQPTDEVIE